MKAALIFLLGLLFAGSAQAEVIQFPDDELATESVLPIFDQPVSVKNRNVTLKGRFELGAMGGYDLVEPFFNPLTVGGTASYHFNEEHGVNLLGNFYLGGVSSYSKQLNPIPGRVQGTNTPVYAHLEGAPAPKWMFIGSYQYTGYYGKMSITKSFIMNLSLYGLLGAGAIAIGDATKPIFNVGVGQKFYFTSNIGLRVDLRFLVYQGPDPLSKDMSSTSSANLSEQPSAGFSSKTYVSPFLNVGAIFLLPNS